MESFGIEVTGVRRRRRKGGGPFLAGAAVHLNFVSQKYYWNGAAKTSADFAGFTGGTFDGGLVLNGVAASFDYSITLASLNISFPCAMFAVFTPQSVTGNQWVATLDLDVNNAACVGLSGTTRLAFVVIAGATQAFVGSNTAVIGTRVAIGGNFETNNVLSSINGVTGGTADTSVTLPAATGLHVGDRLTDAGPLTGTIHHVVIFSGAKTQTELNDLTARVASLS